MPTNFPTTNDAFSVPDQPALVSLSSAGDSARNHVQSHQDLGDSIAAIEGNVPLLTHDHSTTGVRATNKLAQANTHQTPDTDAGLTSLHHTLGINPNQSSPGDHTHNGVNSNPIFANWTSFNFSWTASSTNPTIGDGTKTGQYFKIGTLVFFSYYIKWGSGSHQGSGSWTFSLPTTALLGAAGSAFANDVDGNDIPGTVVINPGSNTFQIESFWFTPGGFEANPAYIVWGSNAPPISGSSPASWSTNDYFYMTGFYQSTT